MNQKEHKNQFSEKVAILKDYQYDGEQKGAQWRLTVKPYLISRAPSIEHILTFIEAHEDSPSTVKDLTRDIPYDQNMFPIIVRFMGISYSESDWRCSPLSQEFHSSRGVRFVAESFEAN